MPSCSVSTPAKRCSQPPHGKADLFTRIAEVLPSGGRFALADLVVPADPADVVTPIDWIEDTPSSLDEQLSWLPEAGLATHVHWRHRDLAVVSAEAPPSPAG